MPAGSASFFPLMPVTGMRRVKTIVSLEIELLGEFSCDLLRAKQRAALQLERGVRFFVPDTLAFLFGIDC